MSRESSALVSFRLPDASARRLKTIASRHGWTTSQAGARLLEEGLRRQEFAFIDFRDSAAGRQAFIQGSRVAVWQVVKLLRAYQGDAGKAAAHLHWPEAKILAASGYAAVFTGEIEEAIHESEPSMDELQRLVPQLQIFTAR